ncbi:hypothetical protein PIB30_049661 [Stylosanthes scabra]|uniref:Uncharacterized protein n=1 Tax=Stylosanthes scabra TaxID=79078 RepID=A0ABU6TH52_9FABA|nr:hypothetical protein [Stylosanthes scabra]
MSLQMISESAWPEKDTLTNRSLDTFPEITKRTHPTQTKVALHVVAPTIQLGRGLTGKCSTWKDRISSHTLNKKSSLRSLSNNPTSYPEERTWTIQ